MQLIRKIALVLSISLATGHCGGAANHAESGESELASAGSWSTQVGGSLATWSFEQIQSIAAMSFYEVGMPVGLGIVHVYIGGVAQDDKDHQLFFTTGLVGETDMEFLQRSFPRRQHMTLIRRISTPVAVRRVIHAINAEMAQSPYHNDVYYGGAMTLTPLLGRPCAKTAKQLAELIH